MQRVGLLVPSVNTVVEPEFWRLTPPNASVHSARMRNSVCGVDDARQMLAHAERAADEVGSALVDVVAFACTASSFVDGRDGETALRESIAAAAKAPAITTSGAVAQALESTGEPPGCAVYAVSGRAERSRGGVPGHARRCHVVARMDWESPRPWRLPT